MSIEGFAPIADDKAKILILGSMPSVVSLHKQQYYAHDRNTFWPIMMTLLSASPNAEYMRRQQTLQNNYIAVWDVLQSCNRQGSLDASIDMASVKVNDFDSFFDKHSAIGTVFFNGAKAEAVYRKHVLSSLPGKFDYLQYHRLPSTSPAHAAMSLQDKTEQWRYIVQYL